MLGFQIRDRSDASSYDAVGWAAIAKWINNSERAAMAAAKNKDCPLPVLMAKDGTPLARRDDCIAWRNAQILVDDGTEHGPKPVDMIKDPVSFNGHLVHRIGVYVLSAVGSGRVKVGFTTDLSKRIEDMSTGCPFDLEVMAFIGGGRLLEQTLHEALSLHHARREWFHDNDDVRNIVVYTAHALFGHVSRVWIETMGPAVTAA